MKYAPSSRTVSKALSWKHVRFLSNIFSPSIQNIMQLFKPNDMIYYICGLTYIELVLYIKEKDNLIFVYILNMKIYRYIDIYVILYLVCKHLIQKFCNCAHQRNWPIIFYLLIAISLCLSWVALYYWLHWRSEGLVEFFCESTWVQAKLNLDICR